MIISPHVYFEDCGVMFVNKTVSLLTTQQFVDRIPSVNEARHQLFYIRNFLLILLTEIFNTNVRSISATKLAVESITECLDEREDIW